MRAEAIQLAEDYVKQYEETNLHRMERVLSEIRSGNTGTQEYKKSIKELEDKIRIEKKRLRL